ncbi:hypothetical protein B5S28_g2053 [[Candida] boidinii]|nr:hypothetical protein B5S28_g2053 [[Candida] boidinii]OWB61082.1 hypothetical protein B5S29_g1966 [[Candida] boidinii]OWB76592.1 hypothetical protein B5S32_g745 [[Candida] boidinii]
MDGVFGINKPPGITSANFLNRINEIFTKADVFQESLEAMKQSFGERKRQKWGRRSQKVKMGHGGTLDPLAYGVLVVGIGKGTKSLQNYTTNAEKVYETVALLGGSTTTGDSEGELLKRSECDHVTQEMVDKTLPKFIGNILQTPPIFSALKMNGKPLYEYARKGLPLPREIKARPIEVYNLTSFDDTLSTSHNWKFLKSATDETDGVSLVEKLSKNPTLDDHTLTYSEQFVEKAKTDSSLDASPYPEPELKDSSKFDDETFRAPILHLDITCSSGTYVRSLVSDFGRSLGSSAYMVDLKRKKQAEWISDENCFSIEDFQLPEEIWAPVLKKVITSPGGTVNVKTELLLSQQEYEKKHPKLDDSDESVVEKKRKIEQSEDNKDTSEVVTEVATEETSGEKANDVKTSEITDDNAEVNDSKTS